ncbi:FMN-linked oxidoreductase [Guyanagaster necrorhizus]|uniref:FMN-linked oxidoreductase n=1 Tax=Guyanagaster necrorhizus TaxID=856835 RepID=A0A9P7VJT2_9AGAR|nr:FMN-linked oxidoreductase [Guyanagaster necrorhizus MCA 3950]KAG7441239.1 FMN-linked oxidoreductase [Guyanagaster necrorhizus MCA 3950]
MPSDLERCIMKVVDGVHAQGSYFYMQIGAAGRQPFPDDPQISRSPTFPHIGASALPPSAGAPASRARMKEEIKEHLDFFGTAATNAAGFDGVKIHGANGVLVDEFIQSMFGRAVEAVRGVVRVRLRLRPSNRTGGMGMDGPLPTFSHLVMRVKELYPDFAYLHVIEVRVDGGREVETDDFIRKILWAPRPVISAGGYTRELGMQTAEEKGGLNAYGMWYISNFQSDLPKRLEKNIPLTKYDRSTFYMEILVV